MLSSFIPLALSRSSFFSKSRLFCLLKTSPLYWTRNQQRAFRKGSRNSNRSSSSTERKPLSSGHAESRITFLRPRSKTAISSDKSPSNLFDGSSSSGLASASIEEYSSLARVSLFANSRDSPSAKKWQCGNRSTSKTPERFPQHHPEEISKSTQTLRYHKQEKTPPCATRLRSFGTFA